MDCIYYDDPAYVVLPQPNIVYQKHENDFIRVHDPGIEQNTVPYNSHACSNERSDESIRIGGHLTVEIKHRPDLTQ